jgi:hypothetical protein
MADQLDDITDGIPDDVEANIDRSVGGTGKPKARKRIKPTYQVIGSSKIPVSLAQGKLWKSRLGQANTATSNAAESWQQAISYYNNDQLQHRIDRDNASGNLQGNQRLNNNITETENVVFANTTTMVPALYARNPKAEFTTQNEANKPLATLLERLVNVIGARKVTPGINLKPKAKRCVVTSLLTNRSWVELNWVQKADSSEQALEDLGALATELQKAKTPQAIQEIEGKIYQLEQAVDILQPSGPTLKVRSPFDVAVDPNSKELDASDANWIMVRDYIPTSFILAKYATKKGDEYKSIYKPTHVMKAKIAEDTDPTRDDSDSFSLYDDEGKASSFGFDDDETFERSKMTEVRFVYDKVTRRVLMYNTKDWTWPIWVWDDPLQLDTFFPLFPLFFLDGPSGPLTKGEVSYYLDQQDAINEIVDEERRARRWARRNIFFNKNLVDQSDVEMVLNGDDGTARGINIPADMKLMDVIGSIPPPSIQYKELFNKDSKYQAIDRISSVGSVLRGEQFKTNTNSTTAGVTTEAQSMRVDEKSDQIEDWIGQIYWGVAQLCLQFSDVETVVSMVGEEAREVWQNMSPQEIRQNFSVTVVGGSTKKPTSAAKKAEALELGQVLGQFANATPMAVIVMLQVMQEAFDEVVIKEEDWTKIIESVQQQQAGPPQGAQPQQAGEAPQTTPDQQGGGGGIPPEQLEQILAQMPPQAKELVAQAIQSGTPPEVAIEAAMQQLQQGAQAQQPQQPQQPQPMPLQ